MQKGNSYTVGQWCDRWFCQNQGRWSGSTVGGYHNLIYRHILPRIGGIPLAELTEDTVTCLLYTSFAWHCSLLVYSTVSNCHYIRPRREGQGRESAVKPIRFCDARFKDKAAAA